MLFYIICNMLMYIHAIASEASKTTLCLLLSILKIVIIIWAH